MVLKGKVDPFVKIAMRDANAPEQPTDRLNTAFYERSVKRAPRPDRQTSDQEANAG
jgi:hypothetical protein